MNGGTAVCGVLALVGWCLALPAAGFGAPDGPDGQYSHPAATPPTGAIPARGPLSPTGNGPHSGLALAPVGQFGGPAQAVAVSGSQVLLGVGPRLMVLDVTDPEQPTAVGQSGVLPGIVTGIVANGAGTRAYVTFVGLPALLTVSERPQVDSGLAIVDVSDPATPRVIGVYRLDASERVTGIAVAAPYAFLAAGGAGLCILDVSTPWQPREVARIGIPGGAQRVRLSGRHAWIVSQFGALWALDVSDPQAVGGLITVFEFGIRDAVAVGRMGYLVDLNGLRIVDLSDPRQPQWLGMVFAGEMASVAVAGDYAYLISNLTGLMIVRITDPRRPVQASTLEGVFASVIAAKGDRLYLAGGRSGLAIVDVTDPSVPLALGTFAVPVQPSALVVTGTTAYVADLGVGLRILDVADPARIRTASSYAIPIVRDVAVAEGTAYVAADAFGLRMVDVRDAGRPREVGSFGGDGGTFAVGVAAGVAYVIEQDPVDGSTRLRLLDVHQPARPRDLGTWAQVRTCSPLNVGTFGQILALGCESGLQLLDLTLPTSPRPLGEYFTPRGSGAPVLEVAVAGGLAYLAAAGLGLRIVDISQPQNPFELGAQADGTFVESVAAGDGFVALALSGSTAFTQHARLRIVDVTDPRHPRPIVEVELPTDGRHAGGLRSVALADERVYLADPTAGLFVWRLIRGPRVYLPLGYNGASVGKSPSEPLR